MNTSQYMDKTIMDLASQGSLAQSKDFIDLMKQPEEDHQNSARYGNRNGSANELERIRREEVVRSYDFQPIRPITETYSSSKSLRSDGALSARVWSSEDSKINTSTPIRNYSSLNKLEPAKSIPVKDRHAFDASSLVSEIDRAMRKQTDDVLRALEAVTARVTQVESRACNLESIVDDLKVSIGTNYGSTDGKMRQLENILTEVQNGVQVLKDKHDILEGHLQLAKLQIPKPDQPQETQKPSSVDSIQASTSITEQSLQQMSLHYQVPHPQVPFHQPLPVPAPAPVAHLASSQPIAPPATQTPLRETYFPPHGQSQGVPNHPYQAQLASGQQQPPPIPSPAASPQHQYPPPPPPQYSQPPQFHPSVHRAEETTYLPPHSQPYLLSGPQQPPPPPSQQLYGSPPNMYEQPPSRSSVGFSSGYGHNNPMVAEPYSYGGPPSQYISSSPAKPTQQQHSQGGESGYPQLPTSRILPQAFPAASGIGNMSGSGDTGARVPVDDVIDKVTTMGFSRDQVRATVRKLTENGQPTDLNIVLDNLMNDSDAQPSSGGWFRR